jgi:hypothetical protein
MPDARPDREPACREPPAAKGRELEFKSLRFHLAANPAARVTTDGSRLVASFPEVVLSAARPI